MPLKLRAILAFVQLLIFSLTRHMRQKPQTYHNPDFIDYGSNFGVIAEYNTFYNADR